MNSPSYFKPSALTRVLATLATTSVLLWGASVALARPGFGGGHFGGPMMNIHPGFGGGVGIRTMRPMRPMRPMEGGIHRVPPYHGPRPEHLPPHGGGGDHHHNDHHHGHYWPYPAPGYWAGVATGAAVGGMVYSLPGECVERVVNDVTYKNCGGTWYRPSYAGTQVVYEVVPAP
ncbi:hypothetical protein M0G74_10245 [Microbulbifer sp. CAU 1566]|uniref:hypothetical protein n=1 Tax=Microbulbifer sp. CAU 1566 TaxID=2933269 RepID=UPI0020049DED|nr:hypothetical protein [Microbulbifer sp. CAU 1566]MCK7597647.1 hypothetical protein [Microbulbifer sp. CAU 1566]